MGGCPSGGGKKHEVQRAPKSNSSIPRKDFDRAIKTLNRGNRTKVIFATHILL